MRRLLRLIAIVAAAAVLTTGTVVALAVIGSNAVHNSASAQEIPLPPLSSRLEVGSTIYADNGTTVLGVLEGPETRFPITLSQVSKTMVAAVLDTEDHGFYQHGGFDVTSMIRAFINDAQGNNLQGGSTIPQQLVKQLYLTPARTIGRKIREAVLADRLEQKYPKNEILQTYLNTIYLGNGAYGVQAAAEFYFHEPASALNLPQSALLAGMISDPNGYDPFVDGVAARQRRAEVLARMVVYHDITPAQEAAANATPLPIQAAPSAVPVATTSYPVLAVENFLLEQSDVLGQTYPERYDELFNGGLKIYTTFDPTLQSEAEASVAADLPANNGGFVEGLVSIDPANGAVRALVGGPSAAASQFDVMTQGYRQPGSGFKVFTLLAALTQGYSVYDTVDSYSPCAIIFPGTDALVKTPIHNDTGNGGGPITVVDATAQSVNCAYIRLAHQVGLANVVGMAYKLGISPRELPSSGPNNAEYEPAIVIGADAVHPIEMADAYAAVADGGMFHPYTFIDHIDDEKGALIYNGISPGTQVVSPQIAAEADIAFRAVVTSGTGTAASLYNRPVAGKTGTTDHNVDAWFNGFTPQLETTVWMGNFQSDAVPIYIPGFGYVYGANFPAETWHTFMAQALADQPVVDLPPVDYADLPPTKYITSPSLVADDVLDHNGEGGSCGYYASYSSYGGCSSQSSYYSNGYGSGSGYTTPTTAGNPHVPPTTPTTAGTTPAPPATTAKPVPPGQSPGGGGSGGKGGGG